MRVPIRIRSVVFGILCGWFGGGPALFSAPIELLKNGGFEEVKDGKPEGWAPGNGGTLVSAEDHKSGRYSAQFTTQEHEWGYCYFSTGAPAVPGAKYHVSVWARGAGSFGFLIPQYSTTFIGSIFGPTYELVQEWRKYEFIYAVADRRIRQIAFGIRLFGKGTVALFDEASFTFDPAENPGLALESERKQPMKSLAIAVTLRNATATLLVNGQTAAIKDGLAACEIPEGISTLGMRAVATGVNPGVGVKIRDGPETDGRWRTAAGEADRWSEVSFNDSAWAVVRTEPDGMMWGPATAGSTVCFRQIVLWNPSHMSPGSAVVPPVKQWGFARGSIETFFHPLHSPLPYPLDDYELVVDLPEGFAFLNNEKYPIRHINNQCPTRRAVEKCQRNGKAYTRYRWSYPPSDLTPEATHWTLLPVRAATDLDRSAYGFYLRRTARGNFTELEQTLPVRILPPINGRAPKRVMISQYCAVPWGLSFLAPEHLQAATKQMASAGLNYYVISWMPGWGDAWRNYVASFCGQVTAQGGHIILWPTNNLPLYGVEAKGHTQGLLAKWAEQNPAAKARYFKDSFAWDRDEHNCFCPTFATGAGAPGFRENLQREYARMLEAWPKTEIIWNDWEMKPWATPDGKGCWCFCELCRASFREFARLPATADLSDDSIFNNYRIVWEQFHAEQEGRIQGEIKKVCNDLGRPYMVYSWGGYDPFWKACRNRIDLAFPGIPGNSSANSYCQKQLDDTMTFYREQVGLPRIMGQRFSFFTGGEGKDGWKISVMSDDGLLHPKSWKSQILRIVASFHGGVDLQSALEYPAGSLYYIGEATRIISEYEPLFHGGERADDLASSPDIQYPNLLVLKLGHKRLALLFNESPQPLRVRLTNRNLLEGQKATVFESPQSFAHPEKMEIVVPPEDVAVVSIR